MSLECSRALYIGSANTSIDRSLNAIKRFGTIQDYNIYTNKGLRALEGLALQVIPSSSTHVLCQCPAGSSPNELHSAILRIYAVGVFRAIWRLTVPNSSTKLHDLRGGGVWEGRL